MVQATVVIQNSAGLHARPAVNFVSTAKRFKSRLTVRVGDRAFNGRSIAAVLSAGVTAGTSVCLEFDGEDEADALGALVAAVEAGLGE